MEQSHAENLRKLQGILQIIALPVTGQIRLGTDSNGCAAALVDSFQQCHRQTMAHWGNSLTPGQREALGELFGLMVGLHPALSRKTWTERDLRCSYLWRKLRRLARVALAEFGWPLELPAAGILKQDGHLQTDGKKPDPFELETALPEPSFELLVAAST